MTTSFSQFHEIPNHCVFYNNTDIIDITINVFFLKLATYINTIVYIGLQSLSAIANDYNKETEVDCFTIFHRLAMKSF